MFFSENLCKEKNGKLSLSPSSGKTVYCFSALSCSSRSLWCSIRFARRSFGWHNKSEVIVWLMSLGGGEEEAPEQPGLTQPDFANRAIAGARRFWVILEQIVKWIVLIAIVIAVIWLLFYVAKRIAKAIRQLYAWLMNRLIARRSCRCRRGL